MPYIYFRQVIITIYMYKNIPCFSQRILLNYFSCSEEQGLHAEQPQLYLCNTVKYLF